MTSSTPTTANASLPPHAPGLFYQLHWHPDGSCQFLRVSDNCFNILGIQALELQENPLLFVGQMAPHDLERFYLTLADASKREQEWSWEGRLQSSQTAAHWIQMVAHPEPQPDGSVMWDGVMIAWSHTAPACSVNVLSQSFLTHIINSISDPIFIKDRQHRWVLLNDAFCKLMGLERQELMGKSDRDFFPAAEADVFWAKDELVFTTGVPNENEESLTDAQGNTHYLSTKKTVFEDHHGNSFLSGIIRDITGRKRMEDQLRARDRLLDGVASATHALLTVRDYHQSIQMALQELGDAVNVDRTYIFQYHLHPDTQTPLISQCWEWAQQGVTAEIDNPELQNFPFRDILPRWETALTQGDPIVGLVKTFPDSERKILESQGIRSILVMPIEIDGNFWGFVRFDDCHTDRRWDSSEQAILRAAVGSIGGAIARHQITEELHESQKLLQLVVDNIPQIIAWKDTNGVFLGCNQRLADAAGMGCPENIVGKTDYEMPWTREQAEWYRQCDRRIVESGTAELGIIEPQHQADGKQAWLETNKMPLRDRDGHIFGILATVEDITERQQAELNLRESEEKFRSLYENTTDAVLLLDEQGVIDCNQATLTIFGYAAKADVCGKHPSEFSPTFQPDGRYSADLLAEHIVTAMVHGNYRFDWMYRRSDGREFPAEVLLTAVPIGDRTVLQVIVRDITERKQAELALQQMNERLEEKVENRTTLLRQAIQRLENEAEERAQMQDQLQASLKALSDFKYALEQGAIVAITNHLGELIEVNKRFCEISGYDRSELLGKRNSLLNSGHHPQEFFHELWSQIGQGRVWRGEIRNCRKNGEFYWVDCTIVPFLDEHNHPQQYLAIQFEVTNRKVAEAEIISTRRFLESVLNNLPVAIVAKEAKELRFALWNPAAERMVGYTAVDVLGKTYYDLFPKEQADFFVAKDREVLASGQMIDIPEEPFTTRQGETRYLHTKKTVIPDAFGNPQYVLAIAEDITARKQAADALLQSQQRLSLMVQQTPLAVIEWNTEFRITAWNPAAERIFGYTAEEAIGQSFTLIVVDEVKPLVDEIFAELIAQAGGTRSINDNITKSGNTIICEWYNTPLIAANGETIGMASLVMDITDRKQAEWALIRSEAELRQQAEDLEAAMHELQRTQMQLVQSEKMSSLGQLVAGVAHEINNPVNFIYGNLNHANTYIQDLMGILTLYAEHYPEPAAAIQDEIEAIDLEFLLEDLPKLLNSMKVGADRIQKIVASLRVFSRMDEAEMKQVDLHEGIDSTLMILQNRIKAKPDRVAIDVHKNYGEIPPIECYAGALNQVFMNILSNAIDALDDALHRQLITAPAIQIQTELLDTHQVCIRISDNGPGIPETLQQRLFDPFFTTKPVGKGTGMGLSISHQIVTEKHHGTLECCSQPDQGATFVITLPLVQSLPPTIRQ
jgi:PAS domain S-box-containing protein